MRHGKVLATVACYWCFLGPLMAQTASPPKPAAQVATDPYGFTRWLNPLRALNGLGPVAYDANLAGWAQSNNYAQSRSGLGHIVMGPARRQNAGWGGQAAVWSNWLASPPHLAALMDPSIRVVGIAAYGQWWTFSAY